MTLCASMVMLATNTFAEDMFKVAVGAPDIWGAEVPRLGQRAGIFKRYDILLDIYGVQGAGETLQAVISGSADFGIAVGTAGVMRAYAKGAPIRVIGANFTGVGDLYWYVRTGSLITKLADAASHNTIAYSSSGSTSHSVVLAFVAELGLKAKSTATGTQPGTLTQVMSGQIDIGWATSPFDLEEIEEGKIRITANGNDVPSCVGKPCAWKSSTPTCSNIAPTHSSVLSRLTARGSRGCTPDRRRSRCMPNRLTYQCR